ncbi:hypothetical protein ACFQHW_09995 [Lapidilactobacillus achengensis]|uniref:Uncharacterized protein n=1 Tax=Lapidilactobacillus achengensis TaxID=2486000 RepID=A0ABW1USL6_9LACO|nr:hypothetical protein [Lapidilactobacillus achengensis]
MTRKSIITGLAALIGFLFGLYFKHIFIYTIMGMAVGYLIVFWIPYFRNWYQRRRQQK